MSSGIVRFPLPSLEAQVHLIEQHRLDTLLFCPSAWALRHRFINRETGETIRARCNRWECLYCGPRKVDRWRQLVKLAEIVHIEAIRKSHVIGYVTKYLTKSITQREKGISRRTKKQQTMRLVEQGQLVEE